MKRIILGLLVGLFMLTGCSSQPNDTPLATTPLVANPTKEITFVNFRDIRDLNPHLYAGEMYAQGILYETLVSLTSEGYAPKLAERWEISDDGTVYTFFIRKGVTFSDGEVCDAHAIKANFDAIIENIERHTWLEMMNLLVSVEATEDYVFVITLSSPYYPMLTELAVTRPFAMISPKAMIEGSTKDGVLGYIGTGPYILKEFKTDEYAIFVRNEHYWGDLPDIETVTVKVIPDNQTRIIALESGELDLIYGKNMIDADAIVHYLDHDTIGFALSDPTSTRQLLMNSTSPILSDIAIRKAIQHATDKNMISEGIFYGLEQAADFLYAPTVPYCDVDLVPYQYDLTLANSILDDAGWLLASNGIRSKNGIALQFTLLYNSNSVTEKTIAEFLQSQYKGIGIDMLIKGEEEQSYRDNMKSGNFDMVFNISWGLPYDPQSSLSAMQRPVYGDYAAQLGLVDKDEIDEAISKIMLSTDEEERQALYKMVLTRLHEDALYVPLTYECNKALFHKSLSNVVFTQSQYEVPFHLMKLNQ